MTAHESGISHGYRLGYQNGSACEPTILDWTGDERPSWLQVRYLKDGAGLFSVGDDKYLHWFDGLALLKQFDIGDQIEYQARFLESPDYRKSTANQKISFTEFATAPKRNIFERIWCTINPNAQFGVNTSTNLQAIDGDIVAIGDFPKGMAIDPETLATTSEFDIEKFLLMTSTPHPQRDEHDGAWYNIGIGMTLRGFGYHVYCLRDGSHRPEPICFIPRGKPAYMHSVAMTERYMVVAEHPMFASLAKFFTLGLRNQPVLDAFKWRGDDALTLYIVDKQEKRLAARVETSARFYFHSTNAYDDGGDVVIDLCTYDDDGVIYELFLKNIESEDGGKTAPPTLYRYRINVRAGTLTREKLTDSPIEFPKVNPHNEHYNYRYTYGVGINPAVPNDRTNQLVKIDVTTGATKTWYEAGCYPNEPFMVPRPGAIAEDDGVVLCVILDAKKQKSALLILDAASFTEIGRAYTPMAIPFGLHGQIMPLNGAAQTNAGEPFH